MARSIRPASMAVSALTIEVEELEKDSTPRSVCQTWSECSTTCSSSPASDAPSEASDSDSDSEEVNTVGQYLEDMNAASETVNKLQAAMQEHEKEKAAFEKIWALNSARLIRVIGADRLARARPVHELQGVCRLAKSAVEQASNRYLSAVHASAEAGEIARLSQQHAASLAQYTVVQTKLVEAQQCCTETWSSVAPYFEAEDEHSEHVSTMDASLAQLGRQLRAAKKQYQEALDGLEMLSEKIHKRRSVGA